MSARHRLPWAFLCLAAVTVVCPPALGQTSLVSQNLGPGAYQASSTYQTYYPELAFDGDVDTQWSSSGYDEWIEVDLGVTHELSKIVLTLAMLPDGPATYEVWISDAPMLGDTASGTLIHLFDGTHHEYEVLEYSFLAGTTARHIQVHTTDSVSWAGWWEIEVFAVTDCAPVPPGLVSWWSGDDNADDIWGDNSGTLQNGALISPGIVNDAFEFDGIDDHVLIGNPEDLRVLPIGLTLSAWVYPAVPPPPDDGILTNAFSIVTKWGQSAAADAYALWLHNPDGTVRVAGAVSNDSNGLSAGTVTLNAWTHVALTYDVATGPLAIYVNGELAGEENVVGGITGSNLDVLIGREDSILPRPFNGLVDEVQIYDRPLTASEILAIASAGSNGVCRCADDDGDGFGNPAAELCPSGPATDCNDADATVYPGAIEQCDGYDNDCDGLIDDAAECDTNCSAPDTIGPDSRVTTALSTSAHPSIAWTGSEYGIAWTDDRDGNAEIYFARLDVSGNKIGADVRVTNAPNLSHQPSLTWTGSEYAIAWSDERGDNAEIYFARLTASGDKIGVDVRITNDVYPQIASSVYPSLVWNGSEYAVAWSDSRHSFDEIYFTRIDAAGTEIEDDVRVTTVAAESHRPSLVWTGADYGVAWQDSRMGGFREIFFARLDSNGNKSIGDLPLTNAIDHTFAPSLAWASGEFGVAWQLGENDAAEVYFERVDSTGNVIGNDVRVTDASGFSGKPSLSWNGSEYGVVWSDTRSGSEIFWARIDALGALYPEFQVSTALGNSDNPDVLWDGSMYGIAWNDDRDDGEQEIYIARLGCDCPDADGDNVTDCNECDDANSDVYPGALQLCDGVNNDCLDPLWPVVPEDEMDADSDGVFLCSGDCDDSDGTVFPSAEQLCDGVNNDCDDADWPTVPNNESDHDGDLYRICDGDCNDDDDNINPGASEVCNGIDDDCNLLTDEDTNGEDTDGDLVHNLCDNCPEIFNATQTDSDGDGVGNVCDNCVFDWNPDQTETDGDGLADACDNCPLDWNPDQDDADADMVGDVCDNCMFTDNPTQSDTDQDFEGDHCDLDDDVIYITIQIPTQVQWQNELGYDTWNLYRGDLAVLRDTGVYTQMFGPENPLARQQCGLESPQAHDFGLLPPQKVAFFLVTGMTSGFESSLGTDSSGVERPNDNPCP